MFTDSLEIAIKRDEIRQAQKTLVKTDRNGTKYYSIPRACPRCGGAGGSEAWAYTGWTCYECGGTGDGGFEIVKEYTPEYAAKLEARRKKAAEKKAAEHARKIDGIRREWLVNHGWTEDGFTFVFLGNTFDVKDAIKEAGGKFDADLGWHIDREVEGFEMLKLSKEGILDEVYHGYQVAPVKDKVNELKRAEEERLHPKTHTSEYQGKIKERLKGLTLTVNFIKKIQCFGYGYWDNGTRYIHSMTDDAGNIYTWTTDAPMAMQIPDPHENAEPGWTVWKPVAKGDKVTLTGTVKDHKEYKGDKQTVLTRCKVTAIN